MRQSKTNTRTQRITHAWVWISFLIILWIPLSSFLFPFLHLWLGLHISIECATVGSLRACFVSLPLLLFIVNVFLFGFYYSLVSLFRYHNFLPFSFSAFVTHSCHLCIDINNTFNTVKQRVYTFAGATARNFVYAISNEGDSGTKVQKKKNLFLFCVNCTNRLSESL